MEPMTELEKRQEEFWAAIKKSADAVRNEPAWMKAGVSIDLDGYTTLGSYLNVLKKKLR